MTANPGSPSPPRGTSLPQVALLADSEGRPSAASTATAGEKSTGRPSDANAARPSDATAGRGSYASRPSFGAARASFGTFTSVSLKSEDRQSSIIVGGGLRNRPSFTFAAVPTVGEQQPAPDMLSQRYIGVYLSYLCVGLIYGSALSIVYPIIVILHGEPNNFQQAVQGAFTVFWSFKVFFGFLSDNVPIFGMRRKPYLLIGWGIAIASSIALAIQGQAAGQVAICQDVARVQVPCEGEHTYGPFTVDNVSVGSLIAWMMANNFGYVLADVAMDSLLIEYAQRESFEQRGSIQGWCYTWRAGGFLISAAITGFGLNGPAYGGSFDVAMPLSTFLWVLVGLQCIGLPWWIALKDEQVDRAMLGGFGDSLGKAWKLMNNKTFSQLMIFNVVMSACQQVTVNARNTVINLWVDMTPLVYGCDNIFQQFIMMITLACAAKWLKHYNWRGLLVFGTVFFVAVMLLFWLVVLDVVRNPWLVIFIDGDQQFAQNIGYLVVMWAVVEMAPEGIEGTTLALTTTVASAGQSLGGYLIIAYNALFSLSRQEIAEDSAATQRQYIYNSLLVMGTQCLYILLIAWMPSQKENARQKFEENRQSKGWAVFALFFVVIALTWGIGSTFAALACPCSPILGGSGCVDGCSSG